MLVRRRRDGLPASLTSPRPVGESHRQFALFTAFRRAETRRWVLSGIAAAVPVELIAIGFTRARPTLAAGVAGVILATIVYVATTIALATLLRPKRVARALDVYRWVGREDWFRFRRSTGSNVPRSAAAARSWLEHQPEGDDALARIELLVWIGQYDSARRLVATLPAETPAERFEIELQRAFVEFVASGEVDLSTATTAAAELTGVERDRADARLAVEAARQAAAAGRDWTAPLEAVRSRVGRRLDGYAATDVGRWAVRPLLWVGLLISLVAFVAAGSIQ